MDALTSAGLGARRNEDIALDLLKFVAATAGVGNPAAPSTGFSGAAPPKPDEHVTQLLDPLRPLPQGRAGQSAGKRSRRIASAIHRARRRCRRRRIWPQPSSRLSRA